MQSLAPKTDFLNLDGVTHLAAGAQTPSLKSHLDALRRFASTVGTGLRGEAAQAEVRARAAQRLARLLGCQWDDLGFPSSVAHGVGILAESIEWRPGDNVVMESWEFPSLMLPWMALRDRGVEVRLVAPDHWAAPLERVRGAIDERTRVLALSHVSFWTGERHDLAAYAQVARDAGALLVVDASHALGVVPVYAPHADFLFSCCYKWVLGVKGVAVAYWNRGRQPDWRPRTLGWHSVSPTPPLERGNGYAPLQTGAAFEPGNPAFVGLYVLDNALEYLLALGDAQLERQAVSLSAEVRSRLVGLGLDVMTPEPADRRAGNVCFKTAEAEKIRQVLEAEGVLVSGDSGRVRVSTHLYNDSADVERGMSALARAREGGTGVPEPSRPSSQPGA
jgi:selenocysteine lyase/cysteine desulfurase